MKKQFLDVSIEFGDQLIKYLKHFGLIEADLVRLINSTNTDDIKEILSGKKGVVLKTAERISNIFGLRYFEFGNPKRPIPKITDLPKATQAAILERKKKGNPEIIRNNDLNLGVHVRNVLASAKLANEFTSSDVLKLLPAEIINQITSRRITDLFRKGELKDKVEDTGKTLKVEGKRGPKEILFRLK
ncbi:MAG: hypothetical protein WC810_24855 [Janthinobacterium sp.]